jgi:hypothetical protein
MRRPAIEIELGEVVMRDGFAFRDLIPAVAIA